MSSEFTFPNTPEMASEENTCGDLLDAAFRPKLSLSEFGEYFLDSDNGLDRVQVFDPVPASEPFTDAAELVAPPAWTELRERIEETNMRLLQ